MKKIGILLGFLFLVGCGDNKVKFSDGGCTVTKSGDVSTITCPDGSQVSVKDGEAGLNGLEGLDGAKGDKGDTGAKGDKGDTGATGAKGQKGDQGKQGKTGKTGATGAKGDKGEKGDQGVAGKDGKDGVDGKDAVILTSVTVLYNQCTQVHVGIWVENIHGDIFDVYSNSNCSDSQGEFCDNVAPSFGVSGSVDKKHHEGSATVCWANSVKVSGSVDGAGDMLIRIEDYN